MSNPEINGAISLLTKTCNEFDLLKDVIANQHNYCYLSMKDAKSDSEFMAFYGGHEATRILMDRSSQRFQIRYLDKEMHDHLARIQAQQITEQNPSTPPSSDKKINASEAFGSLKSSLQAIDDAIQSSTLKDEEKKKLITSRIHLSVAIEEINYERNGYI